MISKYDYQTALATIKQFEAELSQIVKQLNNNYIGIKVSSVSPFDSHLEALTLLPEEYNYKCINFAALLSEEEINKIYPKESRRIDEQQYREMDKIEKEEYLKHVKEGAREEFNKQLKAKGLDPYFTLIFRRK
jgi:hypothetical protein